MPNSKRKRYILTILDSFSRYFTAIPCARDRVINAGRCLYQFFLRHRKIQRIVSSDHGTHFTSEVYKQFCAQMSITQELHSPLRPQSSRNIERWRIPSTCYVRIGTVNGQTYLNPSLHPWMPRSTALLVYPHTTQLLVATSTFVCPNYFQRSFASDDPGACGMLY